MIGQHWPGLATVLGSLTGTVQYNSSVLLGPNNYDVGDPQLEYSADWPDLLLVPPLDAGLVLQ